jgi:hypothetical protein
VLRTGKSSRASDVFSFAIIMWEMLTWQVPYTGYFSVQVRRGGAPRKAGEWTQYVGSALVASVQLSTSGLTVRPLATAGCTLGALTNMP